MNQLYFPIIDEGHGGMKDGVYTSGSKKMFRFVDDNGNEQFTIYEGVVNRAIGAKLRQLLDDVGLTYVKQYHLDHRDVALSERVKLINEIYMNNRNAFLLSIHSNAASNSLEGKGHSARGNEIWTSVGETNSDVIADTFAIEYKRFFSKMRFRQDMSDGDLDKEAAFYILRKTYCPAVLVENGFYDNIEDARFLLSDQGQWEYAQCLCNCISRLNELNPLNR